MESIETENKEQMEKGAEAVKEFVTASKRESAFNPYRFAKAFQEDVYLKGLFYSPESCMYFVSLCEQRKFPKGGFWQYKPQPFSDGFVDPWIVLEKVLMGQIATCLHEQALEITQIRIKLILTCLVGICSYTTK